MNQRWRTSCALFAIGGFLGAVLDTTYRTATEHQFSYGGYFGALFGTIIPFLPVYGLGLALIYLLLPYTKRQNVMMQGATYGGLLTALELGAGFFVVNTLEMRLWDYSASPLNLFGHVDLLHALYWIVLGLLVHYTFLNYPPEKSIRSLWDSLLPRRQGKKSV